MSKHAPPYPNAATDPFNQVPGMNRPTKTMTAETDLLPLYAELQGHPKIEIIKHYTRANVLHHTAAQADEIDALRNLCGMAYQLAGVHDAPEAWLDALSNAAIGVPFETEGLLPYMPESVASTESLRAEVERDAVVPCRCYTERDKQLCLQRNECSVVSASAIDTARAADGGA